jgi:hypothetical protein
MTRFRGHLILGDERSLPCRNHTPYPAEFREQMVELVRAGRSPDELARVRTAARGGVIDAMIELAHLAVQDGRKDESHRWMDAAKGALQANDMDGRISLAGAYNLGLGRSSREERQKRAFQCLSDCRGAGEPCASLSSWIARVR